MTGSASHGSSSHSKSRGRTGGRQTSKAASANSGGKRAQRFKRTRSFLHTHQQVEKDSEEDLEFQKRQPPKKDFNRLGLFGYVVFLLTFMRVVTLNRNSNSYNFAHSVREIVQAQWFESIGHRADYFEYLGVHFFPGLQENSIERPATAPFSLVGAPRIRAVRARQCDAEDNDMSDYLDNVGDGLRCLIPVDASEYETESFGGSDGKFFKHWVDTTGPEHPIDLDNSLRNSYGWEGGVTPMHTYPGTGYLVPAGIITRLLGASADVEVHGTEFYPFPHEAINVSVLEESGWWDPQTVAIFHDVTVVSVNQEMYCYIRLLLEIGADHGLIKPSVQMSVLFLDEIASGKVLLETFFMGYIFLLIFAEIKEFWELYSKDNANELREQIVEHRYRLRQRMLQYAAFQGIMVYQPQPVMQKLMHRLFVKYQDDGLSVPSETHIAKMNQIGEDMMKVHEKWRVMRETGFKPRDETGKLYHTEWDDERQANVPAAMKHGDAQARQALMAVIDLFDRARAVHELKVKVKELDRLGSTGKLALDQMKARFPTAVRLFFRDPWNFLDFLNYTLFLISIYFRIAALFHDIPKIRNQMEVLTEENRYSKFVDFSIYSWRDGIQNNLNAFNAVLTWLKIFKYLEVDPKYKMLTTTLKKSAAMLGTLMQSFVLVLVGSGQGFFMAFGVYLYSFRSLMESVLGLLRMAVGDFDYSELQGAQPVLGPLMFWVYIFLVFFVLMSMFIALIAEAFEDAKDEHATQKAKHHLSFKKLKLLSTKRMIQEAKTRRNLASKSYHPDDSDESEQPARGMGLVSDDFIRKLQPFDQAIEVWEEEIQRQEGIEQRKQASAALGKPRSQRQRRGSVQLELQRGDSAITAIGEAIMNGDVGTWWDSSLIGRWLRSRLYWAEVEQVDNAGHKRNVADWFYNVEMKANGLEYRATENYQAKTRTELSYLAGDIIVVVKKGKDQVDENTRRVIKEGVWNGYRKVDGAGNNQIVRNHHTLEEIAVEDFDGNNDVAVDLGDDGALSEEEENTRSEQKSTDDSAPVHRHTIQLGGAGMNGTESSSDDEGDIMQSLAMLSNTRTKTGGGRRRVQTIFGNPTQSHTYGVDSDIPEWDRDTETNVRGESNAVENQKGSGVAPLPVALTSAVDTQHSILEQQLQKANAKIEQLERKLQRTITQLNERELEIESMRSGSDELDPVSTGTSSNDSRMIKEIHEMLKPMSVKQTFEDKTWTAKGGIARAILEDHDKTKKIETTLRTVVRKLESVEAAAGAVGDAGSHSLPGAVVEPRASIGEGGGASRTNFVDTPSTRLRRMEHKEDAAIEWQRRRKALQTR